MKKKNYRIKFFHNTPFFLLHFSRFWGKTFCLTFSNFSPKLAEMKILIGKGGIVSKLYFIIFFQLLLKKKLFVLWFYIRKQYFFICLSGATEFVWSWYVKLCDNSYQTPYSVSVEDFLQLGSSHKKTRL